MEYKNIILEHREPVALLTVNRPKVLNALNRETLLEIKDALWNIWNNPKVMVLILTGAGEKAFIAGADISEMATMNHEEALSFAELGHTVCSMLEKMPKVTIAAVNGYALGGGCELALACDIVYASSNAFFGQPEVKIGIIPGFGGTVRLPRITNKSTAMEWILSGNIYPATEAMRVGLVSKVIEPTELIPSVEKLSLEISKRGPKAIQTAKRLINQGLSMPQESALYTEAAYFANLFGGEEQREGMKSFLEKREPKFT